MACISTVDVCREILLHGLEVEQVRCGSLNWLGSSEKGKVIPLQARCDPEGG
jgi:hypothetical protein